MRLLIATTLWVLCICQALSASLRHEAYVWQRAWTAEVRDSVKEHAQAFHSLVLLAAEVSWKEGKPEAVWISLDYDLLRRVETPVGLTLRVGPYDRRLEETNRAPILLADLAERIIRNARGKGVETRELQLDFDCATSQLEGYRVWVEIIRGRIAPVPLVITVLPTWMENANAFERLVKVCDSYVLQVHSLQRPAGPGETFELCDPLLAKRAVVTASKFGVPFRVALPTYGYAVGYDDKGQVLGISAEGPSRTWPKGATVREVRASPEAMAGLVIEWTTKPVSGMEGIIWYRFPVASDILNWKWKTLSAMMQARLPRKSVRAQPHRVESGLVEILLENDGEIDISSRFAIQARWEGAPLLAADALGGFELKDRGVSSIKFETKSRPYQLAAGDKHVIGWLRFGDDREVRVEIKHSGD